MNIRRYFTLLLFFGLTYGQTFDPMNGEEIEPQYDPNTGKLIKTSVVNNDGKVLLLEERAISDAKSMNLSHWVLYTPIAGATFFSYLFTTAGVMNTFWETGLAGRRFGKHLLWTTGGATSLVLPYLILQQSEKVIYPNDIISESEKEIYKSAYYNKLIERRILYSIIGLPISAGIGFLTLISLFQGF